MTLTRDAARRWAEAWSAGWESLDVDPILACYAADALLSTAPFREPYRGIDGVRAYVVGAFAEEADPRVWMTEPIVDGDRAAVSWWASLREEGIEATLAGTSVLRFDADGLVAEQWDTWQHRPQPGEPPEWSPFHR